MAEITPFTARKDDSAAPRLNLLLPSINAQHYFGGIHTAVSLYKEMYLHFPRSRIILTDSVPDRTAASRFPDHHLTSSDNMSGDTRELVPFSDRYGKTIQVGPHDCWLATAWWTAYGAQRLQLWQEATYGHAAQVMYLVQDFEPGFYPWSSQYALAMSTYRPARDIAIFNTGLLADFFRSHGLSYADQFTFEPTLNEALRRPLQELRYRESIRKKRIIIYARPSTPRNAFELICEGLRHWGWRDPRSSEWEVVAPGELQQDIDLGPFRMKALGKLDIDSYASLLSTSAIGISLMISPHPSYPPLEMAAFGMGVITNGFSNKDISGFSPNIDSLGELSPESVASALSRQCDAWEASNMKTAGLISDAHGFLSLSRLALIADSLTKKMIPVTNGD